MLKKLILLIPCLLVLSGAHAACTLSTTSAPPHVFTIDSTTIAIDVRTPADTSEPIATFYTDTQGSDVVYDHCTSGEMVGKSPLNLLPQDPSTKIFPTNIDGIGMKVFSNNGNAYNDGTFPSAPTAMDFGDDPEGSWRFNGTSFYKVQFFKTKSKLNLTEPNGQEILPPEEIIYYWIVADNPVNFAQQLNLGEIKLISTPSCSYDYTKTIDFDTVGSKTLAANVERDLDFAITCSTDYGFYSATASISTETPSTDASYIKVTDAAGNSDLMGIKIRNNNGDDMKIDGSDVDNLPSTPGGEPAKYNWKAVLFSTGTKHPADGAFTARAEILLQVK